MASNIPARDLTATPPPGAPAGRPAAARKPLILLSRDPHLLAMLRRADPTHDIHIVASEVDLSGALMAQHAGVAVLDCGAIAVAIDQLTARLQTQFPELVLVVAGGIDEQGLLATQITDGSVHRFLHKPVSEQRVRLFVESAWRRHAETHATPRPVSAAAPAPHRTPRPKWWLVVAALVGATAALAWYVLRPIHAPIPSETERSAATVDAALESLLTRADAALAAGALTTPPGANAADLYREAQRRNARDPRAAHGLEQVITRLLAGAEARREANHLDEAQRLADAARAISPDHPGVAFLAAQIGAQRERAVLGKAQRAAAGGNVAGALAVLDDATRGSHHSTLVDEARQQLAQQQVDARVADFLGHGREALIRGQLIEPAEDNARFYVESARALAPADPAVQQATRELITRLLAAGHQALEAKNPEAAEGWAKAAADLGAGTAEIARLHAGARQLRGAARADSLAHLASAFNERLAAGMIVEPAADSAKSYLAQLVQVDAASPATQQARSAFTARVLEEERGAVQARDFAAAGRWLSEARAAGADAQAVAAADAALAAAQEQAQQAGSYVSASSLKRTRYVAPDFPLTARQRGIDGWVDVQFTVRTDGSVGDAAIVAAQPVGIFEQAALEAVRRWRYQPVLRGGQAIIQRVRVRVRFAMQP